MEKFMLFMLALFLGFTAYLKIKLGLTEKKLERSESETEKAKLETSMHEVAIKEVKDLTERIAEAKALETPKAEAEPNPMPSHIVNDELSDVLKAMAKEQSERARSRR